MKTKLKMIPIVVLFLLAACSKDDDKASTPSFKEENPYPTFLTNSKLIENSDAVDLEQSQEIGYGFSSKVNGKINSVTVKLPLEISELPVTIWNIETGAVLTTLTVNTLENSDVTKMLATPLNITKDVEYAITFNTQYAFFRYKNDETEVVYPFIVENIRFLGFANFSNEQEFPASISCGDLSFKFQQTN